VLLRVATGRHALDRLGDFRSLHRTLAAWWGKLEEAERPLLEPKILSRHDPAGQSRRREPAAYLGTSWGPHEVRDGERPARRRTSCTPRTGATPTVTSGNALPRFTGGQVVAGFSAVGWGPFGDQYANAYANHFWSGMMAATCHPVCNLPELPGSP
jgi:hypothetical protein